jgi:hypothetical protein
MPDIRATDWDKVRLKCSVVGLVLPGLVSVRSEWQDIELDEGALHWDSVGTKVELLNGAEFVLRRGFVPTDLHRLNAEFWLTIGNDGLFRIYRTAEDDQPVVIAPDDEAR